MVVSTLKYCVQGGYFCKSTPGCVIRLVLLVHVNILHWGTNSSNQSIPGCVCVCKKGKTDVFFNIKNPNT